MKNSEKDFKSIQNHLKETGYVFQGSEIYGGLANTWDYGPLGALLFQNIKNKWWNEFITKEPNNYGIDSKILMNPKVWEASGHVANFSDPLIENKINGKRYRADHIIKEIDSSIDVEALTDEEIIKWLNENVKQYDGDKVLWGEIKKFHLMFETSQGVVVDSKSKVYLRPETAQGIFVNFKNVQRSTRAKLPLGIGQVGKSFRNEVTPGNFTFRTREFEQMELEIFAHPKDADAIYRQYIQKSFNFVLSLGLQESSLKLREHNANELAHYSKGTVDIEFEFPFGWGELLGVANRGDFDLKSHQQHSGENLEYLDPITNDKFLPYVIEPSMGLDRLMLALLIDSFVVEKIEENERIVLKLDKTLAPYKFAILPLNKKYHSDEAQKLFHYLLEKGISTIYDENGSIGKRYRRQDSIGTPFVLTIIDETATENKLTIRHRDSMKQETILIEDIFKYL